MADPKLVPAQQPAERESAWLEGLQANGYRITDSRRAVVAVLAAAEQALLANEIYDLARAHHDKLGLVTVYRTLEKLEELDYVQQVHRPDGTHAYLPAFDGHQHLLMCENCGRVEVFDGDDLGDFSRRLEGESGFEIHDHWLQFTGLCADCH